MTMTQTVTMGQRVQEISQKKAKHSLAELIIYLRLKLIQISHNIKWVLLCVRLQTERQQRKRVFVVGKSGDTLLQCTATVLVMLSNNKLYFHSTIHAAQSEKKNINYLHQVKCVKKKNEYKGRGTKI